MNNLPISLASLIQKHNLDISIVEAKDLERTSRIDAEFFQKKYLTTLKNLGKKHNVALNSVVDISDGNHLSISGDFIPSDGLQERVSYFRGGDVKGFFLSDKADMSISLDTYNKGWMKRSRFQENDILLTIVGTVGEVAIVNKQNLPATGSCKLAILRPKNIAPQYLAVFLDCIPGRDLVIRNVRGAVQTGLLLDDLENLFIPLPSPSFQSSIASLVQAAHNEREKSKSLYAEAEKILLDALDLSNWKPTEENIDIKTSEEVRLFGRCDAEFFQPKYDELFARLSKFEVEELGGIVDYTKGVEPGTDEYTEQEGVPFVRVSDVNIQGVKGIEKMVSLELAKGYNGKYSPRKDDILFTKDGTIGISFVVNGDMNVVLSSAFLMLRKKKQIESEYLALILNSIICKLQIERLSGGAIIAHLKPSDAMTLRIPILSPAIQSKISSLIVSSHEARTRSKELLERAKRVVEVFIEEDEETAKKLFDIS